MAGKRLEDLALDNPGLDTPLDPAAGIPLDVRELDWYAFVREIEALLATGEYTWAEETLEGIQQTVEDTHRVSRGQRTALANIVDGAERRRTSRTRRYEGFGNRRY